jgi:hypothetical protein
MNKVWLKNSKLLVLIMLTLVASILRENLALEINAIIEGRDYNVANFYFFENTLKQYTIAQLSWLKWMLVVVFYAVFLFLSLITIKVAFSSQHYTKATLVLYGVVVLGLVLISIIGWLFNAFDEVYFFLRKIIGFIFTPVPVFILFLLFLTMKKEVDGIN